MINLKTLAEEERERESYHTWRDFFMYLMGIFLGIFFCLMVIIFAPNVSADNLTINNTYIINQTYIVNHTINNSYYYNVTTNISYFNVTNITNCYNCTYTINMTNITILNLTNVTCVNCSYSLNGSERFNTIDSRINNLETTINNRIINLDSRIGFNSLNITNSTETDWESKDTMMSLGIIAAIILSLIALGIILRNS